MNCIIIDDNKIARTTMKQLASQVKDLAVLEEFSNAVDAWNFLQDQRVDLLLLDIEMPGMTGLELTKNLGDNRPVIIKNSMPAVITDFCAGQTAVCRKTCSK